MTNEAQFSVREVKITHPAHRGTVTTASSAVLTPVPPTKRLLVGLTWVVRRRLSIRRGSGSCCLSLSVRRAGRRHCQFEHRRRTAAAAPARWTARHATLAVTPPPRPSLRLLRASLRLLRTAAPHSGSEETAGRRAAAAPGAGGCPARGETMRTV